MLGYSRIPIFEGERSNIVGILYTKDLAILDPEDKLNMKTLINLFNFPCTYVLQGTTLDSLFLIFKEGDYTFYDIRFNFNFNSYVQFYDLSISIQKIELLVRIKIIQLKKVIKINV